jgi:cyclopropane fatty-acyl-phospholipid synthase-like methyltransferase
MTVALSGALSDPTYWDDVYRNGRRPYTFPDVAGNRFHWALAGILKRHVRSGDDVLELGCGGSLWLPYLAKVHGCAVAGIDFSAGGLEKAQVHLERNGVTGCLHRADFLHPPTGLAGRFDFVYSLGVVEHFDHPEAVLHAFAGYLKPGGTMLTWIPNTAGWIMTLQRWADREIYDRHRLLTLDDLMRAHRHAGVRLVEAAYTRLLDLSMVNVYRWPLPSYRRWMALAKAVNAPLRWLEQMRGLAMQSKRLSASAYVVAQTGDARRPRCAV